MKKYSNSLPFIKEKILPFNKFKQLSGYKQATNLSRLKKFKN
jgi:hypothetical protein